MTIDIRIVGLSTNAKAIDTNTDLLCRLIATASGAKPRLVGDHSADLTVVYPYAFPFKSIAMGAGLESFLKRALPSVSLANVLRRRFGIAVGQRIVVVSPENLDRRPWEVLGHLLVGSDVPRLTFWPEMLDSNGCRMPYWWNYVDWPEIPRPGFGITTRLGRMYDLEGLCSPRTLDADWDQRLDRAVWLTQHRDFPRQQVLDHLSQQIQVDVLSNVPHGQKIDVLRKYRYCVVTENSTGYGYETEKTPDAVTAGCIPIGFIRNPWSDFNPDAVFFDPPKDPPRELPALLETPPRLDGLLEYLGRVLD